MSSRSTVWDPIKLVEHKERLRRTEFGTLTARVKAVNESLEKTRQQFLETYCGITGPAAGQFAFETDVEFRVNQMIDKFGHKQQLHDDRPKFYGNSVYLAMFERICVCADETFRRMDVSDECRFYGTCSLQLELLNALLTGRFRGAVRARASDIVSTRTFLNVKSPRSSNKFAQQVVALLRRMAEHAGHELSVTDMRSCLDTIGVLKNRYLQVFCRKLEGQGEGEALLNQTAGQGASQLQHQPSPHPHPQQQVEMPSQSMQGFQPGATPPRQHSITPSSHSQSLEAALESPMRTGPLPYTPSSSGSTMLPGIPPLTPIASTSESLMQPPDYAQRQQEAMLVTSIMQELFRVNQCNQKLVTENHELRAQNEALRVEVMRLRHLFAVSGHGNPAQQQVQAPQPAQHFDVLPSIFGEQSSVPNTMAIPEVEGVNAVDVPELDFEMRDLTSIPNF